MTVNLTIFGTLKSELKNKNYGMVRYNVATERLAF